jgi:hypothetical protein
MAAVEDILRSYRRPRVVVREHLARLRSEPRLFTFLFSALVMIFVAQWPRLARQHFEAPEVPMQGLMLGTAVALAATVPFFYALAFLGTLGARIFRGRGDGYGGRLALFWALFAVSPLMLLHGLTLGMVGYGAQADAVSVVVFAVFMLFWIAGLRVTQFEAPR